MEPTFSHGGMGSTHDHKGLSLYLSESVLSSASQALAYTKNAYAVVDKLLYLDTGDSNRSDYSGSFMASSPTQKTCTVKLQENSI